MAVFPLGLFDCANPDDGPFYVVGMAATPHLHIDHCQVEREVVRDDRIGLSNDVAHELVVMDKRQFVFQHRVGDASYLRDFIVDRFARFAQEVELLINVASLVDDVTEELDDVRLKVVVQQFGSEKPGRFAVK